MTRRSALTIVATLAGGSAFAGQPPYTPYGTAQDYRVVDLANVREVIVRLPKGNCTVTADELWQALQPGAVK